MIEYKKKKNEQKIVITYETGEDFLYLQCLKDLIDLRNKDKEQIIGLKEELM